jgi:hypothetical protein
MQLLLVGFFSFWCSILVVNARIFTIVPANDEACFDEIVVEGAPGLKGSFEVLEGGALDIDLIITIGEKPVHSLEFARHGDLDVMNGPGRYHVCFGNRMSTVTEKLVAFSLHGNLGELVEDEDVAKLEHVKPIKNTVAKLADKIQRLQEHERYLTQRLDRHMLTAQSTATRVLVSTGIEAVVLVFVNLAQIWYLRRYFETRRKL